jgi:hypothetical protein
MWLSAEERHTHRQALCRWLLHNCNPCEESNILVILMVRIRQHIPEAKQRKPDAGAASIIYNAPCCKNKRHGIIAAALEVCNATDRLGDGSHLILSQRVRGSPRAVRVVWDTRVFQTDTRVIADVYLSAIAIYQMPHSPQICFASYIAIQSSLWIPRLPLHLLRHYRILQG